jgi:hypothetical protein
VIVVHAVIAAEGGHIVTTLSARLVQDAPDCLTVEASI